MPPCARSAAACIARPRSPTMRSASSNPSDDAIDQAAELRKRVSRRDDRLELRTDGEIEREVRREDRRLTELRLAQRLVGAFALQREQIVAKHFRGALERFARRGRVGRDVAAHAHALRTLARKDDGRAHYAAHRHATAPHDRPPPNATNTTRSFGLIRPARTVSESANGIDAAEVLPYSAMLTMTFSSGSSR